MKKLMSLFCVSLICLLCGCNDDMKVRETITLTMNEPVFMPADVFRSSVKVKTQPEEITQQGKIVFMRGICMYRNREEVFISLTTGILLLPVPQVLLS